MKWNQIEPFVKSPDPAARVVLVYGPDTGLMKERAKTISLSVVEDINDPFNAVTLSMDGLAEDPARLSDEANAMSMMGGQRLIRVQEAGDKLTAALKDYLETPNDQALIVLEGGDLGPRSSLRKLCEAAKNAAAVPCYVEDERDLSRLINQTFQEADLRIGRDAAMWLSQNISGDRQKVRQELEKIITYKGKETNEITLEDVQAACGEASAQSIDELVYSVAGNQTQNALKAYNQLLEDGVNFIVILRSLQNHFRRLHATKARMEHGARMDEAMKKLQPPIFFKQKDAFVAQVSRWRFTSLNKVLHKLNELEANCKKTGQPVETLCSQAILGISSLRG